jgi:hypothetical protein
MLTLLLEYLKDKKSKRYMCKFRKKDKKSWEEKLDVSAPLSVSATGSISAKIAAKGKKSQDPSTHPDYPLNVVPREY